MRVGVFVSETWAAPSTLADVQARAAEAQRLGFASAWVPYLPWAVDPLMALTAAAAVTSTIELGTAGEPTLARKGEAIFYDGQRSLDQWYSCHSCHFEGHTNAVAMDTRNDGRFGNFKTVLSLSITCGVRVL